MSVKVGLAEQTAGHLLADNKGKRIGILIVAYNAVTTLAKVLKRIPSEVWENVEEVVVFDDASWDDTYELAMGYKITSKIKHLNVFKNENNLGYGGNQKCGYNYFMNRGFDVVVLLHGDGQYAPEILAQLYHPIVTGEADAVFGSRMMSEYGGALSGGMPLYKYVGNRILTAFENWSLSMNLSEFHSGYRAYSLAALKQIKFAKMTDNFHFDTEIIIKFHHQGFKIKEVPIPTYYGNEICYVNGLNYAKNVFRSVLRYQRTLQSVACYPEYEEYYVKYPIKQSKYSSHYFFRKLVGQGNEVLDIGCGEGFFASTIANNNRIVGIDFLAKPSQTSVFKQFINVDLETGLKNALPQLEGQKFDKVLLPDVLEHLRFPEFLLEDCHLVLKPHGQLFVSLPNVANITVRLALLLGQWNYTDRGILDKTHYRFYTHRTARHLLEENGYEIIKQMMTVMPVELAIGLPAENPLMKLLNRILAFLTALMPGLLGYQCVFVARSKRGKTI
jgi:glycosyltransferase involved in cell wall biosynthesis